MRHLCDTKQWPQPGALVALVVLVHANQRKRHRHLRQGQTRGYTARHDSVQAGLLTMSGLATTSVSSRG